MKLWRQKDLLRFSGTPKLTIQHIDMQPTLVERPRVDDRAVMYGTQWRCRAVDDIDSGAPTSHWTPEETLR